MNPDHPGYDAMTIGKHGFVLITISRRQKIHNGEFIIDEMDYITRHTIQRPWLWWD